MTGSPNRAADQVRKYSYSIFTVYAVAVIFPSPNDEMFFFSDLHCHRPDEDGGGIDRSARNKLVAALTLCFIFMAVEVLGERLTILLVLRNKL